MSIIDLSHVSLTRQGKTILSDISFTLEAGDRLAVVGPNGAGKSFLLRLLSADLIPSSGRITLLGKTFGETNLWELRRRIGFVSTRLAFYYEGNVTVREVVASGFAATFALAEPLTVHQAAAVQTSLEFFQLPALAERCFETLSDGEKRKTLLARAIVEQPELLIFDEPCQGLDIPSRERFLADVERLAKTTPIVYVTHHVEELPMCINKVLFLRQGTMTALGAPRSLLTSEELSALFEYPLAVQSHDGRYYIQHA